MQSKKTGKTDIKRAEKADKVVKNLAEKTQKVMTKLWDKAEKELTEGTPLDQVRHTLSTREESTRTRTHLSRTRQRKGLL
jgi:hypothetical protein